MASNLSILNPDPKFLPGPSLLHELIPLVSSSNSDAIDHTFADRSRETLTYRELHARSDALAMRLISRRTHSTNSRSDSSKFIIPLFIQQSPSLYVAQLAILKAGGAFCPIPLDIPEERLRFILQDVEASFLLTNSSLKHRLPGVDAFGIEVIVVDEGPSTPSEETVHVRIDAADPAYVMYTSGSTGQPKGVILSHSAVAQAMLAHDRHIPSFSRFLQFANPTFDVSVFEIFFPLFRGCTLVSCDRQQLLNDLPGMINQLQIDGAELTPSVVSSLLGERSNVPGLKLLLTIGEMLKKSVIEDFGGNSDEPAILYGMYGPTEATIHCTLQTECAKDMIAGNIGVPLSTVSAYVVAPAVVGSEDGLVRVLPLGEEGELAVGGFQLADGYLNRDEQTKAAFINDPKHGRLYRTGDRAKLGNDGRLQCLGRISNGQVKLRGQRIELGEIEYAAMQTAGCRSVVADVLDGTLVTFCVCKDNTTGVDDIRARCKQWLPAYMVPGEIVIMDSFPYLSSGKVDRQALANRYLQIEHESDRSDGSLTCEEQHIADVMSTVLKQPVKRSTKLSTIGLDSLTAIQIAAKLRSSGLPCLDAITVLEAVDVNHLQRLTVSQSREVPQRTEKLEAMESYLEETVKEQLSTQIPPISTYDRIYAPTAVQRAMLAETSRNPQAYCNWVVLETKEYDFGRVDAALHKLAHTHALLRSGFVALEKSRVSHAIVQRQRLLPEQIRSVESFQRDFVVDSVSEMLVPCRFQVQIEPGQTQVLIQMHHALYDQWAIDVMKIDLHNCLEGREIGGTLSFQEVSDYQQAQQKETVLEVSLDFWRDTLRGFNPSQIPNLNSQKVTCALDRTTWLKTDFDIDHLRDSSRQHGYSVPSIFQAALTCLLSSYIGSTDVTFGSVFSGRHIPVASIERIFGPCLSTLPFRIDLSSARTCLDLLRLVSDHNRSIQRHSMVPLTEIKRLSGCASASRLFDTLFVWQESSLTSDASVREVDSADYHEFNLVIEYEPSSTGLRVKATFQQSLLPIGQIHKLLSQINHLAKLIVQNINHELSEIFSELDHEILAVANPHPQPCAPRSGLINKIENQCRDISTTPAIIFVSEMHVDKFTTEQLSYAQLHEHSNQLANHLIALGMSSDSIVCIWMEKSVKLYVTILAVLKCGAAYLPVVSETPSGRVASILAQAGVKTCLCDFTTIQNIPTLNTSEFVNVHDLDISRSSSKTPDVPYHGSNLAYAVFTSGSTGTPKGVGVTFDNISGNLAALEALYQVRAGDRLLQACSHAFDVSVFEILFAMSTGMTLCSATKGVLFQDLEQSIRTLQITHLSLTPTVAALVNPANVPSVRFLVTAGEAVTDAVHRKWAGHGLHTGYGPSETTNICNVHMHTSPDDLVNNVGPPLCNTSAFVISPDKDFGIVPAGALGELAFGGEQVFRGYLGRPELNASKIINHPQYGRIYRSGDLGRLLVDGTMIVTGRLDDQIKIRGNRVELGEINSIVLRQDFVSECVTVVRGSDSSEQMLVSFWLPVSSAPRHSDNVELAQGHKGRVTEIYDHLEASLPSYMIPGFAVPVTKMPLTTQGKLDKRSLLAFLASLDVETCSEFSRFHAVPEDDETWTDQEQLVAKALSQTLCISEAIIGRTSSFLSIGLNSLNAIAFAKSLESLLNRRVGIDVILRNQSVVRLARAMDFASEAEQASPESIISNAIAGGVRDQVTEQCKSRGLSIDAILPCTPLQESMLAASTTEKTVAYCNTTSFDIYGDIHTLKQNWDQVVARQAILRTVFIETDSSTHPYVQVVLRKKTLPWQVIDHQSGNSPATEPLRQVENTDAVSLSEPYRIVVDRSSSSCSLTLSMHHAVYDGVSIANLLEEVECLYMGQSLPAAIPFEPFLAQSVIENAPQASDYWSEQLHDFTPKPFPKAVEAEQTLVEHCCEGTFDVPTTEIDRFCRQHSVTQLSLFQTAWAKVLSLVQANEDVCFGNVVSGRITSSADLDRLVAPCFNTIPVRGRLDHFRNNGALLRHMHRQNIDDMKFQLTGLRKTQPLSTRPDLHLFDSVLLLQPPQRKLDSSIWKMTKDEGAMDMPLVVEIVPKQAQVEILLHYMNPIISHNLATDLLRAYFSALSSCLQFFSGDIGHFVDFENSKISGRLSCLVSADTDRPETDENDGQWTYQEAEVRDVLAGLARVSVSSINKSTSIYRLGLDSLNAAQVATQLRSKGLKIGVADVIENRTVAAIAAAAIRISTSQPEAHNPGVDFSEFEEKYRAEYVRASNTRDQSVEAIRPCTSVQNGMIVQSLHSRGALYINRIVYEIPSDVSASDVRRAWKAVQCRHAALRMGFYHIEGDQGPFAMIIYRPDFVPDVFHSTVEDGVGQVRIGEDIINRMHVPAWRLRILPGTQKNTMELTIHHALYDAESLQLLLKDFKSAIRQQDLGPALAIDPLLAATLTAATQNIDKAQHFWKETLSSAGFAKFPNLMPNVIKNGSEQTLDWMCRLSTSTIEQSCKRLNCTLQALGQTAWALLLAAYTGEVQVTFGTVFSGRPISGSHEVAFPNISTIPVYCDTSKSQTELMADMVAYNASAQRYRHLPLSEIQRLAQRPAQPLFDTVFVYQKTSLAHDDVFDWSLLDETASADYTASLELETVNNNQVLTRLTFNTAHIPYDQGRIILRQYEAILASIVEEGKVEDTEQISSVLAAKESSIPSDVKLLHEFVELGARQYPDRLALQFVHDLEGSTGSKESWTYQQLNERGNQVAHLISQKHVEPGNIIAVCMDKCAEASFAFLGILKAGCAFLAMDPDLPIARRRFILEDSGASLLFVGSKEVTGEPLTDRPIIPLSEASLKALPCRKPAMSLHDPNATSYCLYTSGTTGTPKGCELTHENAVQAMMSFQRLFAGRWTPSSRWLQFASYWFDVSVLEQYWSWSVGIAVIGARRDLVLEDLPAFIQQQKITHIDLTPSLARLLNPDDVPSLHGGVFITGGEALRQEIIDAWGSKHTICNGYGPTEATIGVTMNTFVGPEAKPSNIGRQFDNVGSYVLVPGTNQPVLRGAIGELCVSGKLVGKGYLNRPELTEKAFPYLERLGCRVYRTGDLVRLLSDDSFMFEGRKDSQAKLRGQRLETAEIDSIVKSSSDLIADTLATVIKAPDGAREMLVSFLATHQAKKDRDLSVDFSDQASQLNGAARQACEQHLPAYMVPTHFIPITMLPLTVNNKIDGKRLATLFLSLTTQELQKLTNTQIDNDPLNEIERKVAETLAGMVDTTAEEFDRGTNVFSVGLSSVSAITFASALKRQGLSTANVTLVMQHPTIKNLAQALSSKNEASQDYVSSVKQAQLSINAFSQRYRTIAAQKLSITSKEIEVVVPCTPLQEGLILDSTRHSDRPYFNEFRYAIPQIDANRLEAALQKLVDEVQILRTKFVQVEDGYAQVVLRKHIIPLVQPSSSSGDQEPFLESRKAKWLEDNSDELLRPVEFDLVSIQDSYMLVVLIHHALYDGISWQLLLQSLYDVYEKGEQSNVSPSFVDVLAHGPLRQEPGAQSFWHQHLGGARSSSMPKLSQDDCEKSLELTMEIGTASYLESVRKRLGISHQSVLQSCFEIAFQQHFTNTTDYGIIVSGRSIGLEGVDEVIGPLFNTVPQTMKTASTDTWAQLMRRSHNTYVDILPYQHTPLRSIRKWSKRSADDSMFDVLFVFQHETNSGSVFSHWSSWNKPSRADYPLAFEVTLTDHDMLTATIITQGGVTSEKTLHALIQDFKVALQISAQDSEQKISKKFKIHDRMKTNDAETVHPKIAHLKGGHDFTWDDQAVRVRDIMTELAGLPHNSVNEHSTMFSVGLDSIDAVKLSSRLRKAGMTISVSQLLKAQTIPSMLQIIRSANQSIDDSTVLGKSKLAGLEEKLRLLLPAELQAVAAIERVLPATPSQEALVADMLRSELHEYFNHDVLCLSPRIDFSKLRSAIQEVVDRSPILRTSFMEVTSPEIDVVYAQLVHPANKPIKIPRISLDGMEGIDELFENIRKDVQSSGSKLPPVRLTFVTIGSERYLVFSIAHAQYDGHSLALMHMDIHAAYNGGLKQRPTPEPLIVSSIDATSEEACGFWRDTISGTAISSFPQITNRENLSQNNRAEKTCAVSASKARKFCRDHGCSMQALAQICWSIALSHYTQNLEVMFGAVLACRDTEEAEQMMFPAMNTVPVRASLHGSRRELLTYMQRTIDDLRLYQRTSLRTIQALCRGLVRRDGSLDAENLFDTIFIYQQRPEEVGGRTESLYQSVKGASSVEYPVAAEMESVKDSIIIRAACKASTFDSPGVEDLLENLNCVLTAVVQSPYDSTVEFFDDRVSICGLPGFKLPNQTVSSNGGSNFNEATTDLDDSNLSPTASTIREVFSKISKVPVDSISPSASIESIGIDSISAIKVAALLRKESITVSVSQILRAKSVSRIAELLSATENHEGQNNHVSRSRDVVAAVVSEKSSTAALNVLGFSPNDIETVLPATAGQVYMLNLWHMTGGHLFYPTFTHKLKTALPLEKLRQTWFSLAKSHAMLRTTFCSMKGENPPFLQIVLKDLPESSFHEGGSASFSSHQPMAVLFVTKEEYGFSLELRIHHALYDAITESFLMQDYLSLLRDTEILTSQTSYEDFIALSVSSQALQSRRQYWTSYLSSVKQLQMGQPKNLGKQQRVELFVPGLFTRYEALAEETRKHGVTVQALLFIYVGLAEGWETDGDVVLGIYLSNRSHLHDLENLRAPTLNLVPLLFRSPASKTVLELAQTVQADLQDVGTPENSAVGLWEIAEWTGVKVDAFVNFIRLPERDTSELCNVDYAAVEMTNMNEEIRPYSRVSQALTPDVKATAIKGLEDMEVTDAYQVSHTIIHPLVTICLSDSRQFSIDIEVTAASGALNMGLFCPADMLQSDAAEKVLKQTKEMLDAFIH
nr:hydroxamate-type ferrichrome siderophore peptide synthetase [Quercus suber]